MKHIGENKFYAAEGISFDLDCHKTKLNNNVMIVGSPGSGKSRALVTPNLLACNGSYVVSDPKGYLYTTYKGFMEDNGYKTVLIDFVNLDRGNGYNFFSDLHSDDDILRVADIFVKTHSNATTTDSKFWDSTEMLALSGAMGCILELKRVLARSSMEAMRGNGSNGKEKYSYIEAVVNRFMSAQGLRYSSTIRGITNLLDDISREYNILSEDRSDCVQHYMREYLNQVEFHLKRKLSGLCDESAIRAISRIIHASKEKPHNLKTALEDVEVILNAVVQLKDGASPKLVKAVDSTLPHIITYFVEMLRGVDKHGLLTQYALLKELSPECFGIRQLERVLNMSAEKTVSNIIMTLMAPLARYDSEELYCSMLNAEKTPFDFTAVGREKTAVFVVVSDSDRKYDGLVNIFFSTLLHTLTKYADTRCENQCLPIPVSFMMDDFGTNCKLSDFPRMISGFRSRGISTTIILQSEAQLEQYYGHDAKTVIGNCDTCIYLSGADLAAARSIAERANVPLEDVLYMPIEHCWIFRRGMRPINARIIDHDSFLNWVGFNRKQNHAHVEMGMGIA